MNCSRLGLFGGELSECLNVMVFFQFDVAQFECLTVMVLPFGFSMICMTSLTLPIVDLEVFQ